MMRHWAFNFIASACVVPCAASAALALRSYLVYDTLSYTTMSGHYAVASAQGGLAMSADFGWRARGFVPGWERTTTAGIGRGDGYVYWVTANSHWMVRNGFYFHGNRDSFELHVPQWFIAIALLLIALSRRIRNWVQLKLPAISSESRRKIRRAFRLFAISIATVGIVLPLAVLLFGYKASEGWAAVWGTPAIYLLFIAVPIAGIALAWGTLRMQKLRLWKWHRRHLCEQCGYNLTGNASGVCPECGVAVKKLSEGVA